MRTWAAAVVILASMGSDARAWAGCGSHGSASLSDPEYLGARISLERSLVDRSLGHCDYALERACLDWESDRSDAGRTGFHMALRFCDDRAVAERGAVASALAREDFGEAYAVWERHVSAGASDSAVLAGYAPAVHAGLSLTGYPYHGPEAYRVSKGGLDPDKAWRLSLVPGLGLLYVGEPKAAAGHFFLSAGFAALCGWSAWTGMRAPDRDARMVAWMDFGLIGTLFLQRYYLGGMREAHRQAVVKNRQAGVRKAAVLAAMQDPFRAPGEGP